MTLAATLLLLPLITGLLLLVIPSYAIRRILVPIALLAVAVGSVALAVLPTPGNLPILESHLPHYLMMGVEALMTLYILYVAISQKSPIILALAVAQTAIMGWIEYQVAQHGASHEPVAQFAIDKLAILMTLINGLVGGGIILYALGYMKGYHSTGHHHNVKDRQPFFFFLLFAFMSAMFGIIFSNNLLYLCFFWEVTTLCSFLLIGYTQTDQAKRNARKALWMNLSGGLAFALAIAFFFHNTGKLDLQSLLASDKALVLLPAALLCFAGITKSAQLPFSNWLLGAMVAPTPVSALLHSSTMVKAGVYLVLRMAPVIAGTRVGLLVALVGAVTFLVGSLAAITASDAKRVLAWSTVANLGLIVMCGGIGTYEAVWAGILLVLFHAVAKCLMFLCVGLVEHHLHSRDIEHMAGLILKMPRVAILMLIGMAGMFLAPFGMLISKWAVLKAVVDAYPILSVFIAFGSAATLFFWVKWMGRIVEVTTEPKRVAKEMSLGESIAVYGLGAGTFFACLAFPWISSTFIEPFVLAQYGHTATLGQTNLFIMILMMAMVLLFPLSFLNYGKRVRVVPAYLAGANLQSNVKFQGSFGETQDAVQSNYYLRGVLSEVWLNRSGIALSALFLALMVIVACL